MTPEFALDCFWKACVEDGGMDSGALKAAMAAYVGVHLAQPQGGHVPENSFGNIKPPAWHDAPTVPGLWVVGSRCLHINELDLPIYKDSHCRWYGPISDDVGGKP